MTVTDIQLHLASASPRRREILTAMGLRFTCEGADIVEAAGDGEAPEELVLRLASEKANAVALTSHGGLPVLAADTVVVRGNRILGKPDSKEDALDMLALLSGADHRVLTAVVLKANDMLRSTLSDTAVRFRKITTAEAHQYWLSGEPAGKAGAYAIQGIAGVFVESLVGSYSGVVGLPVFETAALLRECGIDVLEINAVRYTL
jgi:septum formation protein